MRVQFIQQVVDAVNCNIDVWDGWMAFTRGHVFLGFELLVVYGYLV